MKTVDEIRRDNLKILEQEAGAPSEMARRVEMSYSQYVNLRDGAADSKTGKSRGMRTETARRFEVSCGKPKGWLDVHHSDDASSAYSGAEIEKTPLVSPGDSRLPIKRALFKLSAGVSGYEIEYENGESDPIFMSHNWFEKNNFRPGKLIAISVQGRSMEPKMYDGDLVIVNTESTTPKDGVVFTINYEGEMVIKRMKRDSGKWFLASDNPDKVRFGDKLCTENCFLLGEVVYLQTETI